MNRTLFFILTPIFLGILLTNCSRPVKEMEEKRVADSVGVADQLAGQNAVSNELSLTTRTPADKKFIKTAETKFMVGNVRKATEQIEDMTVKYSGYLIYSDLRNRENNFTRTVISRDSVVISREIIVENQMVLKIPNETLDSMVRKLNRIILFLDYRIIKMDEVSFDILANQKAAERLKEFEQRQKKHIDTKEGRLKETTNAEESVLERQNQEDYLAMKNLALADQVNYCTLTVFIYQKPVFYRETQGLLNTDSLRPNLFSRIGDAITDGWIIFEHIIVFLFRIWWLFAIALCGVLLYFLLLKMKKKQ